MAYGVIPFVLTVAVLLGGSIVEIALGVGFHSLPDSPGAYRATYLGWILILVGALALALTLFGFVRVLWIYLHDPKGETRDFGGPLSQFVAQFDWMGRFPDGLLGSLTRGTRPPPPGRPSSGKGHGRRIFGLSARKLLFLLIVVGLFTGFVFAVCNPRGDFVAASNLSFLPRTAAGDCSSSRPLGPPSTRTLGPSDLSGSDTGLCLVATYDMPAETELTFVWTRENGRQTSLLCVDTRVLSDRMLRGEAYVVCKPTAAPMSGIYTVTLTHNGEIVGSLRQFIGGVLRSR